MRKKEKFNNMVLFLYLISFSFSIFRRTLGALDFPQLRSFINDEIERNENYLSSSWYPLICQIFQNNQVQDLTSTPDRMDSFYNSVNTLVSNQVCFAVLLISHIKLFT